MMVLENFNRTAVFWSSVSCISNVSWKKLQYCVSVTNSY